jgi:hypothetical protein
MTQTIWTNKSRPNKTARIAYGYMASEEDPLVLVPDPEIIPVLEEALSYLDNGNSLRNTATWLSEKAGLKISHQGLSKIWKEKRQGENQTDRVKQLAKSKKKRSPKTKEKKQEAQLRKKLAGARRSLTVAEKKIKNHVDDPDTPSTVEDFSSSLDFSASPVEQEVIFKPNEGPQTEFLAASEREVLYGGSAGGGKTMALIADPMRYFHNPNFNGLVLRRTTDELREIIWKTQEIYPKAFKGAKWQEKKSQWVFPSGARLWLTYLERDEDVLRYQGQAFSYVGFDELTQHSTPFAWNYMRSRLRTTDPSLPIFMRATTNPGGPGHQWVKRMFIDPASPNKAFAATDLETGDPMVYPETSDKAGQPLFYRRFIPASLYDNPYLSGDGQYEANLLSLPEMQRRQLLEGDWGIAEGAAFPEFRLKDHVVEPFDIPHDWRRFRSCDYGYSSYSAVHWFAIDPSYETLICYRELYLTKHTGRDLAKAVIEAEDGERMQYGILDSSCWHNRGQIGPSIAEEMITMGCRWRPSDRTAGARVAGKNRLHELLKVDPDTELAGLVFFDTCRQIIADLPVIPSNPKGTDDIDARFKSDHAYDSVRYAIMSRPSSGSMFDSMPNQTSHYVPSDSTFGY